MRALMGGHHLCYLGIILTRAASMRPSFAEIIVTGEVCPRWSTPEYLQYSCRYNAALARSIHKIARMGNSQGVLSPEITLPTRVFTHLRTEYSVVWGSSNWQYRLTVAVSAGFYHSRYYKVPLQLSD